VRVVQTETHLFPWKQIVTLSPAVHIKLNAVEHVDSHRFSFSAFQSFTSPFIPQSMAGETDQALHGTNKLAANEGKSNSKAESDTAVTSSSTTMAAINKVDKIVPDMIDYLKKSMIAEGDHQAYHDFGWLTSNLSSSISNVYVSMMDCSTVVCFESHLIARLGLPPSNFLVDVMSFSWV
jgi:hypothetical protein